MSDTPISRAVVVDAVRADINADWMTDTEIIRSAARGQIASLRVRNLARDYLEQQREYQSRKWRPVR